MEDYFIWFRIISFTFPCCPIENKETLNCGNCILNLFVFVSQDQIKKILENALKTSISISID